MVDINLFDKTETENKDEDEYSIKISSSPYGKHFQKITYKIEYKKPIPSSSWFWKWSPFYLYIKFRNRNPFRYYANNKTHIVREVESYFSNNNPNIPLIIGFKRDDPSYYQYYTFLYLRIISTHYGLPSTEDFSERQLESRLKQENTYRNKVKFLTKNVDSQNFKKESQPTTSGFKIYVISANDDEKYVSRQVSKDELFETENLKEGSIIGKLLDKINEQYFDFINIYCIETDNSLVVAEFVSDSTKIQFERKDTEGYYWEKKSSDYNYKIPTQPNLNKIKTAFESTISYQLEKNDNYKSIYNKNKIDIKNEKQSGYTFYIHSISPHHLSGFQKTNVLYKGKLITLVENDQIQTKDKLPSNILLNSKFKEIRTYILDDTDEHLLIKMIRDNSNIYYLHRFNKDGTKWRQISLDYLRDSGIGVDSSKYQNLSKKVDEILNGSDKLSTVKTLLEYIRFEINSIVVLLNNKSQYDKSDIERIIGTTSSEKDSSPIDIDTNIIKVSEVTDNTSVKCIKQLKYNIYKHDLTDAGSPFKTNENKHHLHLRFYLYGKQITLYDSSLGPPRYLTYSFDNNYLFVYFQGKESDRPLLFCYDDQAYKSTDKDSYYKKWFLDINIKQCVCKAESTDEPTNKALLSALNQTKFSNVIYLYEKFGGENFYINSKLFTYYQHQEDNSKKGGIDIYKKSESKKLILKPSGKHMNYTLKYSVVYFNKYDDTNTPLILVLYFKGINHQLYYRLSQFETDSELGNKDTNQLQRLNGSLLQQLFEENDKLQDFLTFDIGMKPTNNTGDSKYNGNKIKVTDDSLSVPQLSNGFKRYKHTPEKNYGTKKSCILYNKEVLMYCKKQTQEVIDQIQGKVLKSLNVYFSSRIDNEPLLIVIEIDLKNSVEWQYYYRKKIGGSLYWQRLDQGSFSELLDELTVNDVHNELIDNKQKLIKLLQKIEFILVNTILLLIEKRDQYFKPNIDSAIKSVSHQLIPKPELTTVQPEKINVTQSNCSQLNVKGYKIYEHLIDLSKSKNSLKQNDRIEFRLLIPTSDSNNKYSEIKLYKYKTATDNDRERIYDQYNDTKSQFIFCFYFYGSDFRPLLLCYQSRFFRPDNKDNFFTKWTRADINKTCTDKSGNFDNLLTEITNVVGFLNKVRIEKNTGSYEIHKFKGNSIKIVVEVIQPVVSESCYIKIIHKPEQTGYRLGDIIHKNDENKLNYLIKQPLLSVGVYYHKQDINFDEPLLIELAFDKGVEGITWKEYHKITKTSPILEWSIDEEAPINLPTNIDKHLDKIRYNDKKVVQIQIHHSSQINYTLMQGKNSDKITQFKQLNNKQIHITEISHCKGLTEANYKCFRHDLNNLSENEQYQIGSLKITISKQLPKSSSSFNQPDPYQEISLYNIKQNQKTELLKKIKEEKDKEKNEDGGSGNLFNSIQNYLEKYEPIYYNSCVGGLYVYFYYPSIESKQSNHNDPRPGLLCLGNSAYRPIKLPKLDNEHYTYSDNDYNKWIRASEITKCGCNEQEKLIEVLNDVFNIKVTNIALIAGSSAGSIAGVGGIAGIIFFIFKKVSSAAAVTTVAL